MLADVAEEAAALALVDAFDAWVVAVVALVAAERAMPAGVAIWKLVPSYRRSTTVPAMMSLAWSAVPSSRVMVFTPSALTLMVEAAVLAAPATKVTCCLLYTSPSPRDS